MGDLDLHAVSTNLIESLPRPDFDAPPLTEVALSAQFDSLPQLRGPQLALFWTQALRETYPQHEEHPPLPPTIEVFGSRRSSSAVRLELLNSLPTPRYWFLSKSGNELIQLQPDRFIFNWRSVEEGDTYPRYEAVRQRFLKHLGAFAAFVEAEGLGTLASNQWEVTYVNHIVGGNGWNEHSDAARVFSFLSSRPLTAVGKPESVRVQMPFVLSDDNEQPLGRLHIALESLYRVDDERPVFSFTLTARGAPTSEAVSEISSSMDFGRAHLVRAFASLTTSRMHEVWRRTDGG